MECFNPSANPSNTCGKGAFGIANAQTLAFRYYVQLDPKFIPKAMWAETSPSGNLIWTSAGNDLIAYRASRVSRANAAPSGPQLDPVKRLRGAVPPTGVTGAVFRKHRLLLAGESNHDLSGVGGQHSDREAPAQARDALLRRVRGPRPVLVPRRPPALADRPLRSSDAS